MKYPNVYYPYQVSFPKSQAGLLGNVYYTIFNTDDTVFLSRRNTNVVEIGGGQYLVRLKFDSEGAWSIYWDIDSTKYVAGEPIIIQSKAPLEMLVYSGYGL